MNTDVLPVRTLALAAVGLYLASGVWAAANGFIESEMFIFISGMVTGGVALAMFLWVFYLPNVEQEEGDGADA